MKSKLLSALLGVMISASTPVMAQFDQLVDNYRSVPFWMDGQTIPLVLLVMERDWKMFYPAYNNLADLDGDGAIDIGFNPNVTYVGYFDHTSCYAYNGNAATATVPTAAHFFVRSGPATPQTEAQALALAPSAIKDHTDLKIPASKHGVCSNTGDKGAGQWHGNWLNYAMTSRIDAIRKVLYGGKRAVDSKTQTILEMIYVPGNAHVWGGELYADDIWEEYAPSSPWYDIASFTGFQRPKSKTMHFWARASVYWNNPLYSLTTPIPSVTEQVDRSKSAIPLFRFVANIPSGNLHPSLKTPVRIWDWVGDHSSYGSLPADGNLAKSKNSSGALNTYPGSSPDAFMVARNRVAYNFAAKVEVCRAGNYSPTEGCRNYGASSLKPVGLLQEYGESQRMFFGLLTGSLQYDRVDFNRPSSKYDTSGGTRYRGGVLRHHIQTFDNYIHLPTGQIKREAVSGNPSNDTLYGYADTSTAFKRVGLISTIDAFEITGMTDSYDAYGDGTQAGNPLGEMLYEAVRYLVGGGTNPHAAKNSGYTAGGGLSPFPLYLPSSEIMLKDHKKASFSLPLLKDWSQRKPLGGDAEQCPKPVIMILSEVFPDHDDDNYPAEPLFSNAPLLTGIQDADVPKVFNMSAYLDKITEYELSDALSIGQQFFYPDNRGLCTAKNLTGGLKSILGHCPSEPSLEGTYNMAAVAYYAHTHNFGPAAGNNDLELSVDVYAVGMAGNFPDITLTVDSKRSVTLMPITLASLLVNSSYPEGKIDNELKTLLNFFIQYWQTDDGHEYTDEKNVKQTRKVPYKLKFSTNFEFTTTPCFTYGGNSNNWERDIFNTFTISLLTTTATPAKYREDEPLYINSGPYKTDRAKYLADRNSGNFVSQTYYYAFKRPRGESLDIVGSNFPVVGVAVHSDTFGSGYGSGGMAGYTITGVTYPGAYIDVGLYRADYPLYYTNRNSFQPGSAANDEPVPLDPSGTGIPGAKWNYLGGVMHGGTHYTTNGSDCYYYHPPTLWDPLLTPAECPFYGFNTATDWSTVDADLRAAYGAKPDATRVCGQWAAGYSSRIGNTYTYPSSNGQERLLFQTSLMRYVQVRSFKFLESDAQKDKPAKLPNPMWLAAKYGGFKDANNNGIPDPGEWMRGGSGVGSTDPYNYFGVANMSELPTQLGDAFEAIANSVATGTANSSSVSMVLGGGVSVQTQYRSDYQTDDYPDLKVKWAGTTYAFFMDKWGNFRADTDGDGKLKLVTSPIRADWDRIRPGETPPADYEVGDLIIHTVAPFNKEAPRVYLCRDPYGDNNGGNYLPSDPGEFPNTVPYPPNSYCGIGNPDSRGAVDNPDEYIKSLDEMKSLWNSAQKVSDMDLNDRTLLTYLGDEKPDGKKAWTTGGVILDRFESDAGPKLDKLHSYMGQSSTVETENLIRYVWGEDFPGKYRSRTARLPWDAKNSTPKVWRMGDVINSQPVLVGQPSSGFNQIYHDPSYAAYRTAQSLRRQVSYFGSNDGILHATNLGFFGALVDGQASYTVERQDGTVPDPNYELGAEIWGYLPPSILAHLQLMAHEAYEHSYYVDLTPQVVDIKDGTNWRTILVVGLRLGGAPIELANGGAANPYTTPEFFALDVTDPESPPKLLWRFTHPTLGQSTAKPAVVRSGHDDRWYIVLPSGPAQVIGATGTPDFAGAQKLYAGRSNQKAKVIILDAITGKYARDRDLNPGSYSTPDPLIVEEKLSFFNDTFTPMAENIFFTSGGVRWGHHVVYLGLTCKDDDNYDSGALYRLQMVDAAGNALPPDSWELGRFYKTDKPVTAAVNSSLDRVGNLWVLFGTGRIWSKEDMTPCGVNGASMEPDCVDCYEQYLYGIKEPLGAAGRMTFAEVPKDVDIVDVSGISVYTNGALVPTTNATGKNDFESLYSYMLSKNGDTPVVWGYKAKVESWRKDINNLAKVTDSYGNETYVWSNPHKTDFELIHTQVQLDELANGRVNAVVTSYLPSNSVCEPLGSSYVFVYDAFTGLPAPYMGVYGGLIGDSREFEDSEGNKSTHNQVTVMKKVGAGMASQAWVLKVDGGTTYGATGFAGQRVVFRVPRDQSDHSRFISWREVLDLNLGIQDNPDLMFKDLLVTP